MSFKVLQPTVYQRILAGKTVGVATLLGLYTIDGAVLPFIQLGGLLTSGALIAPLLFAPMVAYIHGRLSFIPPTLIDELSSEKLYTCRPCSANNLRVAADIVRPIFGSDNVEYAVLEQWRLRNPQGFMEIVNESGILTACFVILGIDDSFMRQLIEGRVTEGQIEGNNVERMRDAKKKELLYISGVMVRDAGTYAGAKRSRVMLWCMLMYLRHHYKLSIPRRLYALALNRESERLLKTLGFHIVSPAPRRRDAHNFYEFLLTTETWQELHAKIADFRLSCKIEYTRNSQ